jgi:hypothetical protein
MFTIEEILIIISLGIAICFSMVTAYQSSSRIKLIRDQHDSMYNLAYQLFYTFFLIELNTPDTIESQREIFMSQLTDLKSAISRCIQLHLWTTVTGSKDDDRRRFYTLIRFITAEELVPATGETNLFNVGSIGWDNFCIGLKILTKSTTMYLREEYSNRYFSSFRKQNTVLSHLCEMQNFFNTTAILSPMSTP